MRKYKKQSVKISGYDDDKEIADIKNDSYSVSGRNRDKESKKEWLSGVLTEQNGAY